MKRPTEPANVLGYTSIVLATSFSTLTDFGNMKSESFWNDRKYLQKI